MRLLLNPPITPPRRPYNPADSVRFDPPSMAMAALVLLLALFFLAFFSVYARRILSSFRHRCPPRHPPPPPSPSPRTPPLHGRIPRRHSFATPPVCGLDPSALGSLPVLSYVGGGGGGGKGRCVVCLSEFEEKEKVKVIPGCGHVFHPECIDAWLLAKGSCPVCRCSDMVTCSGFDGRREVEEDGERERERVASVRRTCSF